MSSGAIKAGKAFVEMVLDDEKLRKSLRSVGSTMNQFGQSLTRIGAQIGGVGAAITAPIALSVKNFSDIGDMLDKMSRRTGITVEQLSALKFAAEQSGASLETVEIAVKNMARSLYDASRGSTENVEALSRLGLTVRDLRGLDPGQQFMRLATALSQVEDPSTKAALALKLFGRSGTQILPLLTDGPEGIAELTRQASAFGLVMSRLDTTKAAELTDAINIMRRSFEALRFAIGAAFAEQLTKAFIQAGHVIARMQEWVRENQDLIRTIGAVGAGLTGLGAILAGAGLGITLAVTSFRSLFTVLGLLLNPLTLVGAAFGALAASGTQWKKVFEDMRLAIEGIANALKGEDWELIGEIMGTALSLGFKRGMQGMRKSAVDILESAVGPKTAGVIRPIQDTLREAQRVVNDEIRAQERLLKTLIIRARVAAEERRRERDAEQKQDEEKARAADLAVQQNASQRASQAKLLSTVDLLRRGWFDEAAMRGFSSAMDVIKNKWLDIRTAAQGFLKDAEKARDIWAATRTPLERAQERIYELADLLRRGVILPDTFDRAVKQLKDELTQQLQLPQIGFTREGLLGGARAGQVFTEQTQRIQERQLEELIRLRKQAEKAGLINSQPAFQ